MPRNYYQNKQVLKHVWKEDKEITNNYWPKTLEQRKESTESWLYFMHKETFITSYIV